MKLFLAIVISLVIGFLIGFVPMSMKRAELNSEIEELRVLLDEAKHLAQKAQDELSVLNAFIGAYEGAMNKNYGIAQTRAITGFDKAEVLAKRGVAQYGDIISLRDETVSILAKATDDAQPKVRLLLFSLYRER
ncbi:MAG TPA: hypothetical protein ENN75_04460 [candidate division Zixibacteria bacterium]|nr:hypothetical protein [candidate division Zixibacteria bacterium]